MITCGSCNHQGVFRLYLIRELGKKIYLCDECGVMYLSREDINSEDPDIGEGYETWIEHQGIEYGDEELVPIGNWWLIWFSRDEQKYVGRIELKGLSFDAMQQIFKLPTNRPESIIHGAYIPDPIQCALLCQHGDTKFNFSKYAYFVEFEDEYKGHISAESQNYMKDFAKKITQVQG